MRVATVGVAAVIFLITSATAQTQSKRSPSEHKTKLLDLPARTSRPNLSSQDALKIAEKFVDSQKIDITHYWLYRANFMVMQGPTKPQEKQIPGWHFWWLSDSGEIGNYVEIFVSMDGACTRVPSL